MLGVLLVLSVGVALGSQAVASGNWNVRILTFQDGRKQFTSVVNPTYWTAGWRPMPRPWQAEVSDPGTTSGIVWKFNGQ